MGYAQLNNYCTPQERRVNILLLIYAVINNKTVDEAFEFLVHNIENIDRGRKKPISNTEIIRLRNSGMKFYEIADIFGVQTSTITRRYKKVSRETGVKNETAKCQKS